MNQEATYRVGNISTPRTVQILVSGMNVTITDSKGEVLINSPLAALTDVQRKTGQVVFRFDGKKHSLEFISAKKKVAYSMFGLLGVALMYLLNSDMKQKSQDCFDAFVQGGAIAK